MSDDPTQRTPQDINRINVRDPGDVQYWTKTLGCSKGQLECAVDAVGTSALAVRKHLAKA